MSGLAIVAIVVGVGVCVGCLLFRVVGRREVRAAAVSPRMLPGARYVVAGGFDGPGGVPPVPLQLPGDDPVADEAAAGITEIEALLADDVVCHLMLEQEG